MKQINLQSIFPVLLLIFCFFSVSLYGQKQFEGAIRYEISQSGQMQGPVPVTMEYYFKGNDMAFKALNESGNELVWILLVGKEQSAYLIDDEQRTAFKIPLGENELNDPGEVPDKYKEQFQQALKDQENDHKARQSRFIKTGDTEINAGYSCKKFRLLPEDQDKDHETYVWLSEEIIIDLPETGMIGDNPLFRVMNQYGFPLKLMEMRGGSSTEMKAVEVTGKKLGNDQFRIPDGFSISDISSLEKYTVQARTSFFRIC